MTAFLTFLRRFPKIFQNCSEGQTNVPEHFTRMSEDFLRFPKISEDFRRLSRKTRRCFDDTPTNLGTMKETNLISQYANTTYRNIVVRNMLRAFGHRVATCWVLLGQIWPVSNLSQQHPTCCNTSQHGGQTHVTCCAQQCWDILVLSTELTM